MSQQGPILAVSTASRPSFAAALDEGDRPGTWHVLRADYPADAFSHQRQVLAGAAGHGANGCCRACPAEAVAAGAWQDMIDYCAVAGEDVAPRPVPDIPVVC